MKTYRLSKGHQMKKIPLALCALLVLIVPVSLSAQLTYTQFAIATGTVRLDGTNPTSVTTGLRAIRACTVTVMSPSDSATSFGNTTGGEPVVLSIETSLSPGRLDIYAWDNADPPAASTSSTYFINYFCVGDV